MIRVIIVPVNYHSDSIKDTMDKNQVLSDFSFILTMRAAITLPFPHDILRFYLQCR